MSARRSERRRVAREAGRAKLRLDGDFLAKTTLAKASKIFVDAIVARQNEVFALRINRPTDDRVFVTSTGMQWGVRLPGEADFTRHLPRTRALAIGVRDELRTLRKAIEAYPREAAFSPDVALARQRFRTALADMHKLDIFAEAVSRTDGGGHA
jgi:hypothetical protein